MELLGSPKITERQVAKFDDLSNGLRALQHRWNDRITGKDFQAIGESYDKGRVSVVINFGFIGTVTGQIQISTRGYVNLADFDLVVVAVRDIHVMDRRDPDGRDDQPVFISIGQIPNLPKKREVIVQCWNPPPCLSIFFSTR